MRIKIERLGKILMAGALALGTSVSLSFDAGAQDAPADAQQTAQNESGAARISFIQGDVSTQHDGSTDWSAATVNTPVVPGDHISTGPNAKAEIQLDFANVLRMSDQTTANVVSLNRNQIQLQVGQGLATYDALKNGQANVEIDTPNVAVRPAKGEGSYRVLVNSDGETIVDVRKGSAEISTPQGSAHVERDQRITIQGSGDNAQYQISGAPGRDDWDRWNADRDRSIEGAQSWHNTNPYYTGTQDLDANGHWGDVPDYGPVWFPSAGPGWAPYRDGRWVWEPYYGWTWVSYEPWGWAPYHYGRWFVYGGNWGWWPGPVYAGYYPVWAPAYVSFFGFGGGGFGFGFGVGFGSVGWLPCGPGDRFFPWYGRGITRVTEVNVYNIHNHTEGFDPLRNGPRAYSNVDLASHDARVRAGFSSMESSQFGRERVQTQQSRIDASKFGQAHVMTGANPVSPSHESYQSTSRAANPRSIPSRSPSSQHFFSGTVHTNGGAQAGAGNVGRGGSFPANSMKSNPRSIGPENSANMNRGPGAAGARQPIESSRPGWHTFTPPSGAPQSGRAMPPTNGRTIEGQGAPAAQGRPNFTPPSQQPRAYQGQNNPRGNSNGYGSNRPTLDMHQPVVTPRGGGSNPSRGPSGGNHSAPPAPRNYGGGSRPAPPSPAPRGGSSGGGSRGGNPGGGGGPRGGSSGGGHNHR